VRGGLARECDRELLEETDEDSSRSQEYGPLIFAISGQVRHTGSASWIGCAVAGEGKISIGSTYHAPVVALYSANPLLPLVDSLRAVARDTVIRAGAPLPVLVIDRPGGTR
jgi:hypothetical protein